MQDIPLEGTSLKSSTHNHPSATDNQLLVSEYIKSEVECGRLVGPVPEDLVPLIKLSPIGLIPKPRQVVKWQLIVDLSYPRDHSVNAGISEELASVTYAHVIGVSGICKVVRPGSGCGHLVMCATTC